MRNRRILASVLVLILALGLGVFLRGDAQGADGDAQTIIPEEEVNIKRIKTLFEAALVKCEIDEDGDLAIEEDGLKSFIMVDTEKKLLTYVSAWGFKEGTTELRKLQFANQLNDELIVVRFCIPKPDVLYCDYQLSYENGLYAYQAISTYRLFVRVVRGGILTKDTDDIIN